MLIDFHSGEFPALHMTFLGKVMPKFSVITEMIIVIGNNSVHDERKQCG
jgi:hypothetical protein